MVPTAIIYSHCLRTLLFENDTLHSITNGIPKFNNQNLNPICTSTYYYREKLFRGKMSAFVLGCNYLYHNDIDFTQSFLTLKYI